MTTDLATLRAPKEASLPAVRAGFFDLQSFELIQRVSKAFAGSDLVPKQYQGNLANCMIAMDMAQRIGANPLMVMQNLYIVHGTPGWSSKFLIATINACGRYSSLRYEWKGKPGEPGYGCRAWAIERETSERLDGIWVTWEMVRAEGWDSKNGSKWKTMADQMFVYRSASFWQRAYAPELGMGLQTAEEINDVFDAGRGDDGRYSVDLDALRSSEKVDRQTGEITDDILGAASQSTKPARKTAGHDITMTFAKVAAALESSKDRDTLDLALDMIRLVADEQQREELAVIGRRVAAAIEAAV
jgi:hypothetical protein